MEEIQKKDQEMVTIQIITLWRELYHDINIIDIPKELVKNIPRDSSISYIFDCSPYNMDYNNLTDKNIPYLDDLIDLAKILYINYDQVMNDYDYKILEKARKYIDIDGLYLYRY